MSGASVRDGGFSLIEALVALVVLSVATVGLIRAAEGHVDTVRGLQDRAAARWVAENRLVELALPGADAGPREEEMLGRRWRVTVETRPTDEPELGRVVVSVAPADDLGRGAVARLEGFLDRGAATAVPR